ncbi:hypothetical protein HUT19_34745 [Streptomyces sp. NA02950]|uniref:hypothetical protein n=1 Tax=Streptomyces sp. NA02950 TaxID=2742137 RepID=UPI0015901607|nr:hypothetical protein [Streptomyces sp. NA02950]QKV96247.1 hypothetical protein HUT19_34745 [Streptomyces sp. NA02950]
MSDPPRAASITDLGSTLREPLVALKQWSIHHMNEVLAARPAYDHRGSTTSPESAS